MNNCFIFGGPVDGMPPPPPPGPPGPTYPGGYGNVTERDNNEKDRTVEKPKHINHVDLEKQEIDIYAQYKYTSSSYIC